MRNISIQQLDIHKLEIPFKLSFSHAQATRNKTQSILVIAKNKTGIIAYGEGCPRSYVTGESCETAISFFNEIQPDLLKIASMAELWEVTKQFSSQINKNPAAWSALEGALINLIANENLLSVENLLNLPKLEGNFKYTAILDAGDFTVFKKMLEKYQNLGMQDYKIKISGCLKKDQNKFSYLRDHHNIQQVRIDANNLWHDPMEAISYLQALQYDFFAVEEPLQVNDYIGCAKVAKTLDTKIILDESFINEAQFEKILADPIWIINLRVSKMGGLIRSLKVADLAKKHKIPLIIGAQVGETSLLTRAALSIANTFRDQVIAQEGAFGTNLLEYDIVEPSLMFKRDGILHSSSIPQYLDVKYNAK